MANCTPENPLEKEGLLLTINFEGSSKNILDVFHRSNQGFWGRVMGVGGAEISKIFLRLASLCKCKTSGGMLYHSFTMRHV